MPRVSAIALALSLLCLTAGAPALHIHVYRDHDHSEHHHGLAAHQHPAALHTQSAQTHFERCDAGSHAVAVILSYVPVPHATPLVADVESLTIEQAPRLVISRFAVPLDVRGHSPPALPNVPLRGPPSSLHA